MFSRRVTADKQLTSAEVSLTGPINARVITDTSGNYEFANLPGGQYTLTPMSIAHTFNPLSRTVTITNGNITGLYFAGTFVPANITGHVRDNNGNPLAGIRIQNRGAFPEASTFTDAVSMLSRTCNDFATISSILIRSHQHLKLFTQGKSNQLVPKTRRRNIKASTYNCKSGELADFHAKQSAAGT